MSSDLEEACIFCIHRTGPDYSLYMMMNNLMYPSDTGVLACYNNEVEIYI